MKLTFDYRTYIRDRLYGYLDLSVSIYRSWSTDRLWQGQHGGWRHITIGLRSPIILTWLQGQRPRLFFDGLRFGYGEGNLYLGPIWLITTFRIWHGHIGYRRFGPLTWARPVPYWQAA